MFERVAELRAHEELLTYVVRDAAGNVLLSSHDAKISDFPDYSNRKFVTTDKHRIFFDSALQGNITISIADPLAHRQEAIREAGQALLIPLLLLVPVSLLSVFFLVRITMRPVRAFTNEIQKRNSGDLTPVEVQFLPTEIAPTANAVNQLLERLRRALEAERTFTANSAHELRTPVAAALAQAQRLISEATDNATADRAKQIEAALIRLSSLSEKLMQLAKSEGARLVSMQAEDVVPALKLVISDFQVSQVDAKRLRLDITEDPVLSTLDVDAFAILARNLIENAFKHGSPGSPVHVCLSTDGEFRVINDCDAIPNDVLDDLKKPFIRGETNGSGTGLGLAIVSAIAAGSGCQLRLQSPIKGSARGLEISVFLAG
jgi:two-component system, OmpR family, sensor kinase